MLSAEEDIVSTQICIRFCESLPDEGLLALAHNRLEELPDEWRHRAQCSVIVRRHKASGARAMHHVEVDFDRGVEGARIFASSSDADPYAALSRAFDSARASMSPPG
jgi:ribosome-associated translation inhibitor RaiA